MLLALILACDPPMPTYIDKKMIEKAHIHGDTHILCGGLNMKEDTTRGAAADILATVEPPESCLCEHLMRDGAWDPPVLRSMGRAKDDLHAECAGALLDRPKLADRAGLVTQLARIKAPSVVARLTAAAREDADPLVRAAAMAILRPAKDADALALVTAALSDANPAIRTAAATSLAGIDAAAGALASAAKDADAGVRAAAIAALRGTSRFAEVACPALASDAEPGVRAATAAAMSGTRDEAVLACLRTHMLENEADPGVRGAMLLSLRKTTAPAAASALCDAIPFWIRTYVGAEPPEREGPADILFAQNDRDFERSYECVQKALKAGGYRGCGQRYYLNDWFHELGGKNAVPRRCDQPAGGGGREITF
ncbi:MAG: hypothetical protein EXR71_10460 [Myxococcales bacterium]|nr:hypothetical protein [Myxococcales bacterium]